MGFFGKFLEVHKVMYSKLEKNSAKIIDNPSSSSPNQWPFLGHGIKMWQKDSKIVFLLGNPAVFFASASSIIFYAFYTLRLHILQQRGIILPYQEGSVVTRFVAASSIFSTGWAVHYMPYFLSRNNVNIIIIN
jgi:dolichyl-phosphate-mannose--protein O-mannosyl transferase